MGYKATDATRDAMIQSLERAVDGDRRRAC